MITNYTITVRAFPLKVHDHSTGEDRDELLVLTRAQLQAAQLVGQSSTELIERLCDRAGLTVLGVGKPQKRDIALDLGELYRAHTVHLRGKREKAGE